ncbi:MAG: FAD-binding protein [Fimbriimonadaceae bacterium]|nr:FAD-binding protein [Fimbriimonadaceae bacterium]
MTIRTVLEPLDLPGFLSAIQQEGQLAIAGAGTQSKWLTERPETILSLNQWQGIEFHSPADLVVTVLAGTRLVDLQQSLAAEGQYLPFDPYPGLEAATVGGLVAMALPHKNEKTHGLIKDWVIGMTILTTEGMVAKSGALVVKSVAGFDMHKLLTGSRGGLAVILSVNLRVFSGTLPRRDLASAGEATWIWRVLPTRFASAMEVPGIVWADPTTHTLGLTQAPPRWRDSWWMGPDGERGPKPSHSLEERAKTVLDSRSTLKEGFLP